MSKKQTAIMLTADTTTEVSNMLNSLPQVVIPKVQTGDVGETYLNTDKADSSILKVNTNKSRSEMPLKDAEFVIISSIEYSNDYINGQYRAVPEGTGVEACEAMIAFKAKGKIWRIGQLSCRGAGTDIVKLSNVLGNSVKLQTASDPNLASFKGKEYLLNKFSLELKLKESKSSGYNYMKVENLSSITSTDKDVFELATFLAKNVKVMGIIQSKMVSKTTV